MCFSVQSQFLDRSSVLGLIDFQMGLTVPYIATIKVGMPGAERYPVTLAGDKSRTWKQNEATATIRRHTNSFLSLGCGCLPKWCPGCQHDRLHPVRWCAGSCIGQENTRTQVDCNHSFIVRKGAWALHTGLD